MIYFESQKRTLLTSMRIILYPKVSCPIWEQNKNREGVRHVFKQILECRTNGLMV